MLKVVTLGNSLLNQVSEPVNDIDEALKEFVREMYEIMIRKRGVGLAAVQVGRPIRLFITKVEDDPLRVFINPEIVETSVEQESYEEGCLSIPGINADVVRSSWVKIQAWNENGKPFTLSVEGFPARVIQHEFDHLNGVLFIDRVNDDLKNRLVRLYTAQKKAS
jgi:peptide deformylase